MIPLYLLTDYQGRFGSKWGASPYRSGLEHGLLAQCLAKYDLAAEYVGCADVFARPDSWRGRIVVCTSSEDVDNNYKRYIEDIAFGLEEAGARLLPRAAFVRAHNNKVFMEILREQLLGEEMTGLRSRTFGTLEELGRALQQGEIPLPCVLKASRGSMSRGVALARTAEEVLAQGRRLSRSRHLLYEARDYLRSKKRSVRGYRPESRHQRKLMIQPLIPGLDADWKVLVFGDQYYVLKRHVRVGDFRASGSHVDYRPGGDSGIPGTVLDLVKAVYEKLDLPHLSVDMAFDGKRPYLFEFQAIYFGTSTQCLCEDYYTKQGAAWTLRKKAMNQEEVFAWGIAHYLRCHPEIAAS